MLSGDPQSSPGDRCVGWHIWCYWSLTNIIWLLELNFCQRSSPGNIKGASGPFPNGRHEPTKSSILVEAQSSVYRGTTCYSPSKQRRFPIGSYPKMLFHQELGLSLLCTCIYGSVMCVGKVNSFILLKMPCELKHFNSHVMLCNVTLFLLHLFKESSVLKLSNYSFIYPGHEDGWRDRCVRVYWYSTHQTKSLYTERDGDQRQERYRQRKIYSILHTHEVYILVGDDTQ